MNVLGQVKCCYQKPGNVQSSRVICNRLLEIAELKDEEWGEVGVDACQVCQGTIEPQADFYNDVLASLLYRLAQRVIDQDGIADCSVENAKSLRRFAEAGLRIYERPQVRFVKPRFQFKSKSKNGTVGCDVILNLTLSHEFSITAIESILSQQQIQTVLHLVVQSSLICVELEEKYGGHSQVRIYQVEDRFNDFEAVAEVVGACRSEFIALQSSTSISDLTRIAYAVEQLSDNDAEVFGSDVYRFGEKILAKTPANQRDPAVPVESLVFRRNTYLDCQLEQPDLLGDVAFVYRCLMDGRKVILSKDCSVATFAKHQFDDASRLTKNKKRERLSPPVERLACDVVLPFRDHLDFVNEAVESICNQENCDVILHLVDDASRQSTDRFFEHWSRHSNIRCYRNTKNLGQYTSFNNIQAYLETDFVAIQDGDDISFPHRLATAIRRLKISHADIFTGGMQVFGGKHERYATAGDGTAAIRPVVQNMIRYPRFPNDQRLHFVMNSTVVMRASKFRELGGFTDYGSSERNRAGLDTEFYIRAYYSNHTRFFLSRQTVTKYRRHADSATQTDATGFGSSIRTQNRKELEKRSHRFRETGFDAREFGAIGRYQVFTKRLDR